MTAAALLFIAVSLALASVPVVFGVLAMMASQRHAKWQRLIAAIREQQHRESVEWHAEMKRRIAEA